MKKFWTSLLFALILASPLKAEPYKVFWHCQDWEAINYIYEPVALHRAWQEGFKRSVVLNTEGAWIEVWKGEERPKHFFKCKVNRNGWDAKIEHVIGEVFQPMSERWYQVRMILLSNGLRGYTIGPRR